MRRPLLAAIRLYQRLISPSLGVACRYEPSCSHYAYEAVETHGAVRGVWLAIKRLARCRPGGGSGYDPVPERRLSAQATTPNHVPPTHASSRPPKV